MTDVVDEDGKQEELSNVQRKEIDDLIQLILKYCKMKHIHHVASIDIRNLTIIMNNYYSYKSKLKKRKSVLKKIKLFQIKLQKEFHLVWGGTKDSSIPNTTTITGERMLNDVDLRALWYQDTKCNWMWYREGYLGKKGST